MRPDTQVFLIALQKNMSDLFNEGGGEERKDKEKRRNLKLRIVLFCMYSTSLQRRRMNRQAIRLASQWSEDSVSQERLLVQICETFYLAFFHHVCVYKMKSSQVLLMAGDIGNIKYLLVSRGKPAVPPIMSVLDTTCRFCARQGFLNCTGCSGKLRCRFSVSGTT